MQCQGGRSIGIIYVSFGEMYRHLTLVGIRALRNFGYRGPIRVLSDHGNQCLDDLDCEIVELQAPEDDFGSRHYKTKINDYGFDTTLFLDADTLVIASIGHMWRELRFGELCMSLEHPSIRDLMSKSVASGESGKAEFDCMHQLGLLDHPHFNTGVMLFQRSNASERLFKVWHEEWQVFRQTDQLAMVRAVARTGLKIHGLSPHWNHRPDKYPTIEQAQRQGVRILHFTSAAKLDLLRLGGVLHEQEIRRESTT